MAYNLDNGKHTYMYSLQSTKTQPSVNSVKKRTDKTHIGQLKHHLLEVARGVTNTQNLNIVQQCSR